MKRTIVAFGLVMALCGTLSAAGRQKSFSVTVDPPDAAIKVSGSGLKEQTYRSPATVPVPDDPEAAKKSVIEISRDRYRSVAIPVRTVRAGEALKIRLEKLVQRKLKFRMVAPAQSDAIMIRDGQVQIDLRIDEKDIQMSLTNSMSLPIRLLWQRASYTDASGQQHRVMHPGIRYEERNRSFPYQTIMPFMTIHEPVMPVDLVMQDRQKKQPENAPLFPPDVVERSKGKTFELLLPIEIENKGVVPYTFRVKVLGMVQE